MRFGRLPAAALAAGLFLAPLAAAPAAADEERARLVVVVDRDLRHGAVDLAGREPPTLETVGRDGWIAPGAAAWAGPGRLLFSAHATPRSGPGAGRIDIEVSDVYLGAVGGLRRLTAGNARSVSPDLSPDGRRIVFASDLHDGGSARLHTQEIYVVGADGSGLRRLTRSAGQKHDPRWSPDGRSVVFARTGAEAGIHVLDVATGRTRRIAERGSSPDWSPDGRYVLYLDAGEVVVVPAAGGAPEVRVPRRSRRHPAYPRWTPWGILYTWRDPFGDLGGVSLLDAEGETVDLFVGRPGEQVGAADLAAL